jgi:hypothetical protein
MPDQVRHDEVRKKKERADLAGTLLSISFPSPLGGEGRVRGFGGRS